MDELICTRLILFNLQNTLKGSKIIIKHYKLQQCNLIKHSGSKILIVAAAAKLKYIFLQAKLLMFPCSIEVVSHLIDLCTESVLPIYFN